MNRWTVSNKAIFNLGYHLIFCPKYRKSVLVGDVENRLKELLMEKALELQIDIKEMEIMPDHVHLFVKTKPNESPHTIVGQLKGYSSRILRQEFKDLRKLPSLWTRSYFAETVGCISETAIRKYIANQKNV
jgi:putative transposase